MQLTVQMDRQTDRQTDRQIDRQTHRQTVWSSKGNIDEKHVLQLHVN